VNNNESDNYSDKIDENSKISFGKKNGGSDWKKTWRIRNLQITTRRLFLYEIDIILIT